MEKNQKKPQPSNDNGIAMLISNFIMGYFSFSYRMVSRLVKSDNFFLKRHSRLRRLGYFAVATMICSTIYYVTPSLIELNKYFWINYLGLFPILSAFGALAFAEELFHADISYKITSKSLTGHKWDFKALEKVIEDRSRIPVGISFLNQKPITIETRKRVQHMMISGGSGQGKSSFAITLRRHDLRWKRPIIDIDPKGSNEDISVIKEYCKIYGRLDDFKHFNITDPDLSFCYNPLALGSVDERIEKITTVLELDNEFYRGFASNMFSIIFQSFDALNIKPTMKQLCELLLDKNSVQEFFKKVLIKPSSEYEELKKQILAFRDFDKEKILGIQAKISRLNSPLFSKILNPSVDNQRNLDLVSIVKNNQYAYFQLNIAQYKEVSTYLINFILYDLKLVCGAIDGGKLELNSDFLPVYIDEFASFGNEDFPEFLRVARSGRVGITVMFQSFASLDMITPVLKDEIATNTIYSVHFFPGSVADIDFISMMPGTLFTNQRSLQVLGNGTNPSEDSKGTQFRSEEMKVDPNIYRELKPGQAAIYLKDRNEMNFMNIWHGKAALSEIMKDQAVPITNSNPVETITVSNSIVNKSRILSATNPDRFV